MLNQPTNFLYKLQLQRIKEENGRHNALRAQLLEEALKAKKPRLHTRTKHHWYWHLLLTASLAFTDTYWEWVAVTHEY